MGGQQQQQQQQQQQMRGLAAVRGPVGVGQLRDALRLEERLPVPEPKADQVLVKVTAATMSVDDLHAAEGAFLGYLSSQPKKISTATPLVPGLECCGTIVARGADCPTNLKVGDVVLGFQLPTLKMQGVWAEYAVLPSKFVVHKPAHLDADAALASFLSGLVGCVALSIAAPVLDKLANKGPVVAVCGATGGIGTLVLQAIRHKWPTCKAVIGICSSRSAAVATTAGATQVVAYDQTPRWGESAACKGKVDVVIDLVGGSAVEAQASRALKRGGRFVTMVGPIQYLGDKKRSLLQFLLWGSSIGLKMGNVFRKHSYRLGDIGSKAPVAFKWWNELTAAKVLQPHVERTAMMSDIKDVKAAIDLVASHHAKGKVVMHISSLPDAPEEHVVQ